MTPADFRAKYYPYALQTERAYGIPALATLAQAALESGWGRSAPGNMFFGIKTGSSWKGKRQLLSTTEVTSGAPPRLKAGESITKHLPPGSAGNNYTTKHVWKTKMWFRAYDSPKGSFDDRGEFFKQNSRYHAAFAHKDPKDFLTAIAKAGYATAPNYAATLHKVVDMLEGRAPGPTTGGNGSSGGGSTPKPKEKEDSGGWVLPFVVSLVIFKAIL